MYLGRLFWFISRIPIDWTHTHTQRIKLTEICSWPMIEMVEWIAEACSSFSVNYVANGAVAFLAWQTVLYRIESAFSCKFSTCSQILIPSHPFRLCIVSCPFFSDTTKLHQIWRDREPWIRRYWCLNLCVCVREARVESMCECVWWTGWLTTWRCVH